MKKQNLSLIILAFTFPYICCAYVLNQWNPMLWEQPVRVYNILFTISLLVGVAAYIDITSDKNK